jgi:hypothetical protein
MTKQGSQDTGEATLIGGTTSEYVEVYSDKGSGASMDVRIWRPIPDAGFFILGHYAQGNYASAQGSSLVIKASGDPDENDPSPPIKKPTGAAEVWNDHGSKGKDSSIWLPKAPNGYVSIGCVGTYGYEAPDLTNYACVRKDLVKLTQVGVLIWNDKKSGAHMDVSLYSIVDVSNVFVAQSSYQLYYSNVYQPIF